MSIDGKEIAREMLAETKERAGKLPCPPHVVAYYASETPATRSYLAIKTKKAPEAGCFFEAKPFPLQAAEGDAIIVQLPLFLGMSQNDVLDAIPIEKDADVLSAVAREKFEKGDRDALLPPVVGAIKEILERGKVNPRGKHAVVVGEGWLVGSPAALWLKHQGARVEVANIKTDLAPLLANADIIISGAGVPGLIKPEMLKEGVVLIDAATSESNGIIAGDADPACAAKCSLFTPVPGGVGPIAVACLFANVVTLAERCEK